MSDCGGCDGMGAHKRWCRAVVGPRAALLGPAGERAESLGDTVGGNEPGIANKLYAVGGELRALARDAADEYRAMTARATDD